MKRVLLAIAVVMASAWPAAAQVPLPGVNVFTTVDGSAAQPSRRYIQDPDTGTYRIGPNNEGFAAGAALRWDYDTTRLKLSASYQLLAGANTLIGSVADKLNAAHLAIASQAIGDLLFADSTTTFARRAAVATGQVLASAGVGTAPAYTATPTVTTARVGAGSGGAPSLLIDDTDTGFFSAGTDAIGASVNGVTVGEFNKGDGSNGPEFRVYRYKTGADAEFLRMRWTTGGIPPFQILTDQTGTGAISGLIIGTVGDMPVDIGVNNAYRWTFQGSAQSYALHSALAAGQDYGFDVGGAAGRVARVYSAFGLTAERRLTADSAGRDMVISAESATLGATNKASGTLYLDAGLSTGNAAPGKVIVRAPTAIGSGTTDTTLGTHVEFGSNNATFSANIAFNANASVNVGAPTVVALAAYSRILSSDSGNNLNLRAPGSASVILGSNGTDWWQMNLAGTFFPIADGARQFGSSSNRLLSLYSTQFITHGANGQFTNDTFVTTTVTCNSGTSTCTASNLIPAGSIVLGVDARVTTILAGAALTTWQLGDGSDADRWGTGLALAAGTTVTLANATITSVPLYAAATNVVLTAAAGVFSSGVVRLTVHYITINAATS